MKWKLKLKKILGRITFLRSLRFRLFVIFLVVGIVPSVLTRYGIMENYEEHAIALRTTTVQTQLRILANHLITYNYLQDNSSEVVGAELDMLSNLYEGRVLIIGGNFKVVKDTYAISEGKIIISEEVIRSFGGESLSNYDREVGNVNPAFFSPSSMVTLWRSRTSPLPEPPLTVLRPPGP